MIDPTADNITCKKCGHRYEIGENLVFHLVDKHLADVVTDLLYASQLTETILEKYLSYEIQEP